MAGILEQLPDTSSDDLLVGMDTMDDAGVFRLDDDTALVQSVDFFYPVVNDPRSFGRIVAANSLSDIWAMGARAITAMNLLACPAGRLPQEALTELLIGGSEKLREAGVCLVGGHSMENDYLLYGMSVTGLVDPCRALTNAAPRIGDALILTKPLGTGILVAALEAGVLAPPDEAELVAAMERLNKYAVEVLAAFDVSCLTDVTGFGLFGHALPSAQAGDCCFEISLAAVPRFAAIDDLLARGLKLRGVGKSKGFVTPHLALADGLDEDRVALGLEAQTSGGLLAWVRADQADAAVCALRAAGDAASAVIGHVAGPAERRADGTAVHLRLVP